MKGRSWMVFECLYLGISETDVKFQIHLVIRSRTCLISFASGVLELGSKMFTTFCYFDFF